MPPSLWLSAFMATSTYLTVAMRVIVQMTRDSAPMTVLAHRGEAAVAAHDRLERVHRARSDVTVDDAKRNENHRRG